MGEGRLADGQIELTTEYTEHTEESGHKKHKEHKNQTGVNR